VPRAPQRLCSAAAFYARPASNGSALKLRAGSPQPTAPACPVGGARLRPRSRALMASRLRPACQASSSRANLAARLERRNGAPNEREGFELISGSPALEPRRAPQHHLTNRPGDASTDRSARQGSTGECPSEITDLRCSVLQRPGILAPRRLQRVTAGRKKDSQASRVP
jgi:hypothetical protein